MDYTLLKIQKKDHSAVVTLCDTEKLNAFSKTMLAEVSAAITELEADKEIRCVVVTGSGKAFIAGADISFMKDLTSDQAWNYSRDTMLVYDQITRSEKIYIAAVNGFALGAGLEFCLACDICLASERARFGLPEVRLGIIPGGGGTQRLIRRAGLSAASEMIYTGKVIKAEEAEQMKIVSHVYPQERLPEEAEKMALDISEMPGRALAYAKRSIKRSQEVGSSEGIEYERNMFSMCFATKDQKTGMQAFLKKEKPVFENE